MSKKKITTFERVLCDKKGCKKVIGYKGYNGRIRWRDGVHQCGYFSTCGDKHLKEVMKLKTLTPPKKS